MYQGMSVCIGRRKTQWCYNVQHPPHIEAAIESSAIHSRLLEWIAQRYECFRPRERARVGAVSVILLLPANGSASIQWLGGSRDVLRGRGLCTSPRDFGGLLKINWNQVSLGLQSLFVLFIYLRRGILDVDKNKSAGKPRRGRNTRKVYFRKMGPVPDRFVGRR